MDASLALHTAAALTESATELTGQRRVEEAHEVLPPRLAILGI